MIDSIFTGDIMPGAKRIGGPAPDSLTDSFAKADIAIGNLESPLVGRAPASRNPNKIPLWSTVENIDVLNAFHFSHLCLNNNHIYDLYDSGLDETITLLDTSRITGFGLNHKTLSQFQVIEKNGIRLGLLAFNWVQPHFSNHLFKPIGAFDIGQAKASADHLICLIHWGDDHNIYINRDQQQTAHALIDQGVDLIIGSHPHVPQGWEAYNGKHIFYSLGNFIFTPQETYTDLPYQIRYDDHRENILFQREECKIGLYVNIRFDPDRYHLTDVVPIYRRHTLPGPLPDRLSGFYHRMKHQMNDQVKNANYHLNDTYKKMILKTYTLPLILKHLNYWPIFFKKLTLKKARNYLSNRSKT